MPTGQWRSQRRIEGAWFWLRLVPPWGSRGRSQRRIEGISITLTQWSPLVRLKKISKENWRCGYHVVSIMHRVVLRRSQRRIEGTQYCTWHSLQWPFEDLKGELKEEPVTGKRHIVHAVNEDLKENWRKSLNAWLATSIDVNADEVLKGRLGCWCRIPGLVGVLGLGVLRWFGWVLPMVSLPIYAS